MERQVASCMSRIDWMLQKNSGWCSAELVIGSVVVSIEKQLVVLIVIVFDELYIYIVHIDVAKTAT